MRTRNVLLWLIREYIYIPITILTAAILFGKILVIGVIPTGSMEPNYPVGSFFVGLRMVDRENMERGDAVLFHFGDEIFLKRLIGLPGETVIIHEGIVYVNDEPLDESAYLDASVLTRSTHSTFAVPEGHYFFLGDNRADSYDARYWGDPYIATDTIVGKLLVAIKLPFWGS